MEPIFGDNAFFYEGDSVYYRRRTGNKQQQKDKERKRDVFELGL